MRILHLLSQLEITGAEAYAVWLAESQIDQGDSVYIVSDRLHLATRAPYTSQPIAKRSFIQRIKNVIFLCRFVRENNIEIIHSHSRAASWVAYAAAFFSRKIVFISTVHGRQHLHRNPRTTDVYGERVIAVCENVATHLFTEMGVPKEKIITIRNGMNFENLSIYQRDPAPQRPTIVLIGRSSGPKGQRTFELIEKVFPEVLKSIPGLKIIIGGGILSHFPASTLEKIQELNRAYPNSLELNGSMAQTMIWQLMANADLVIGSGRVAITALGMGVPTFALGEASAPGLVSEKNLGECLASNFGDIWPELNAPNFVSDTIAAEMIQFFQKSWQVLDPKLIDKIKHQCCGQKNAKVIRDIYAAVLAQRAHPKHIPVLMFHKVTDQEIETKHKIFVTRQNFDEQMQRLASAGFTSLTFKEYETFRVGSRSWAEFPKKPIFLTFDDAYADNHRNALPILNKYGLKAIIFALGDPSLKANLWDTEKDPSEPAAPLMDDHQLKEVLAAGFEIGAHSLSHRDLTKLSPEESTREILESKKSLEQRLGTSVISFAYPYGKYNDGLKSQVRSLGFKFAVATDTGGLHLEEDPFAIFRASVFPQDDANRIKRKSATWYRRYYRWMRGK